MEKLTKKELRQKRTQILQKLDDLDERYWNATHANQNLSIDEIPDCDRWFNSIGESDALGNFKVPAHRIADNEFQLSHIRALRNLVSEMKWLSRAAISETQEHRDGETQTELNTNLQWAKCFGLSISEISEVLGEPANSLTKKRDTKT